MSPLDLSCPACQCLLRVPGVKPGNRVRCPKCSTVFAPEVPATPAVPVAEAIAEPAAPASLPVPPPAPAPAASAPAAPAAPTPAAKATNPIDDDDVFAKIAEADDPVAAAADVRKPKPVPGESDNPLSLDDDEPPPAKTRPTATSRKAPAASKSGKDGKDGNGAKGDKPAK